jgi:diguanylate cyclase (GGDEF)-like protein
VYWSLIVFTFATALTFHLLAHRVKRSYYSLLVGHQERSIRDSLTGLYNRLGWYERSEAAIQDRASAQVSVLYLDMDHFKRVNDHLGHAEGDRVLQVVATNLTATFMNDAVISRFGGEEFVVLLTDATAAQARVLASRLQAALHEAAEDAGAITLSAGIAERMAGESLEDVVLRADHALLSAKALGRNRIEIATVIDPQKPPIVFPGEVVGVAPSLASAFSRIPEFGDPGPI